MPIRLQCRPYCSLSPRLPIEKPTQLKRWFDGAASPRLLPRGDDTRLETLCSRGLCQLQHLHRRVWSMIDLTPNDDVAMVEARKAGGVPIHLDQPLPNLDPPPAHRRWSGTPSSDR